MVTQGLRLLPPWVLHILGPWSPLLPGSGSVNTQRVIHRGFQWPGLRSGVHQFHAHSNGQHPVMCTPNAKAAEDYNVVVCQWEEAPGSGGHMAALWWLIQHHRSWATDKWVLCIFIAHWAVQGRNVSLRRSCLTPSRSERKAFVLFCFFILT